MAASQPQGFLAGPASGNAPGVLVLHAWWGLNDTFKSVCTRLSESGFVAFAPDLYHGKIANAIPDAETLAHALFKNQEQASADMMDSVKFLVERTGQDSVVVIGFSMGANYALDLSAADPEHIRSVVLFYGTGAADFAKSKAAYLGHFAENDPYEPPPGVDELEQELKKAGRPVTFYRYPGTGHWFFEPDRVDAYDEAAAKLAWDRTLEFLKRSANA